MNDQLIVIGVGGIGTACVERFAHAGREVVVADTRRERSEELASRWGSNVHSAAVDISDRASVRELVESVAQRGPITGLVLTAGVSPTQAPIEAIVAVDLVGTAIVLEELENVLEPGGAAVVIASMAGHIFGPNLSAEEAQELIDLAPEDLAQAACVQRLTDRATAYGYAKRGNQLRVRAAAGAWGRRKLRINSVSPGLVDTEMGRSEAAGDDDAEFVHYLTDNSPIGRAATPQEIAATVAFLMSDDASYVTGTDILVDGGATTLIC